MEVQGGENMQFFLQFIPNNFTEQTEQTKHVYIFISVLYIIILLYSYMLLFWGHDFFLKCSFAPPMSYAVSFEESFCKPLGWRRAEATLLWSSLFSSSLVDQTL